MKFEIQQEDFQAALDIVASIVPAKTTLPILTCVLFETVEDRLKLSATNLDVSVSTVVDTEKVVRVGRIAVPSAKLATFVRSLEPGVVKVEQKGGKLIIRAGKAGLEEVCMNADEFPALPELQDTTALDVDANLLTAMIDETSYAVSRDETRPALMGILWEVTTDKLTLVATDAHRLAMSRRTMEWDVAADQSIIVDTGGLRQIPRIVAHQQADDEGKKRLSVHIGDKQLSVLAGDTVLHTRLLEGPFPDYEAVIPSNNEQELIADREALIQVVRRVAIAADRITNQIRVGVEKDRIEFSAEGTEGSRSEDEMQVAYDGEALEIGFNFSYLQDVLKHIKADQVKLLLRDATNAVLVEPVSEEGEESGLLCLLMPLRLTNT